jgi:hypothetical protein
MTNTKICPSSILSRTKLILTDPIGSWSTISGESTPPKELTTSFLLPLVAAGAVAAALGKAIFGIEIPGLGTWRPSLSMTLANLVSDVALRTLFPFVGAWLVVKIAEYFGGITDYSKSFRWVIYGSTPCLAAGLLGIVPPVGAIASLLCGFYALYISYQGIMPMLGVPEPNRVPFIACTIISFIVASFILALVFGVVTYSMPSDLSPSMVAPG